MNTPALSRNDDQGAALLKAKNVLSIPTVRLLIKCCNGADDSYKTVEGEFEKGYEGCPDVVATADDSPLDRALVGLMNIEGVLHAAVSIRGTKENENWIQNVDTELVDVNTELVEADIMKMAPHCDVRVHRGYQAALQQLFSHKLKAKLESAKRMAGKDTSLLVIGHSKGGGMAVQLAHALLRDGWKVLLVTFGAPPTGNAALSNYLEDRLGNEGDDGQLVASYRVVNSLDIVPHSLSWKDAYQHFGEPIVLDYPLLETLDTVLNIAGNIAGVCKGETETLEAAVETGTGLVQHHLLHRYLENLNGQGNWDYQKGFEYAKRGVKSISMFLDKTGLKDQLADKLKDLGEKIGPAFSGLVKQQNTGCARELVKQLNPHIVKDLVPSGGAAVNTISNAGSYVANVIGLVVQVLNLGVSCVTLYKVHHLQAAVVNIQQKMGTGFEDVMAMQGRWGGELKDLMGQGFEEILEKIREQNEESLLTAADKICALVYTDWRTDSTEVAANWAPNFRTVYQVCKKFLRALAKHLPKGDQADVENKELAVWLLQMTMNSAWLCLGYAQRLQLDIHQLLCEIYDEIAIMLGRLVLHQQLETVESLLLSEQLNALCRLVVGDGVVRCPLMITTATAPSPQLPLQKQRPPPHPPLSAQPRLPPPPLPHKG
jgi:hypothetical protein